VRADNRIDRTPGLARLDSGRWVASFDLGGPGMQNWPEPKGIRYGNPAQTEDACRTGPIYSATTRFVAADSKAAVNRR
jgi:hypothetical protein